MDNANARADEPSLAPETPEDVAILYSWANLPGAKYRDFSASRREYRAQQRARSAEAQRQTELKAARELEEAAQREIELAQRQLEETRQAEAKAAADAAQAEADAEAKRHAEEVLRRAEEHAERERQEALRRQQSAEELRVRAERAQDEMLEARKRAEEQAARYAEADLQSQMQTGQKARVLPGETTDPYYYTGPVDPAYFASTPGVRTAQAARVSTERKAYVYPMHPGSDEYDSGTVVAYRGSNPFAPSPVQPFAERGLPLQEVIEEHLQPSERADLLPTRDVDPSAGYNLDNDYYDGDHATRLFTPSPRSRYAEGLETARADLHIRPATRVSGDHERQTRVIRPSPLPQFGQAPSSERLATVFGQADRPVKALHDADSASVGPSPVFFAEDTDGREDGPARGTVGKGVVNRTEQLRSVREEDEVKNDGKLQPIRFEEQDSTADESRSSRMFIPSPRRRLVHPQPIPREMPEQTAEPTLEETRRRDAAAMEGRRLAQAETESRVAQDRFVHDQQTGSREADNASSGVPQPPAAETANAGTSREEPVQWRSLNRAGESGFRRRRQPAREPMARTMRQPRTSQEPESAAEALSAGELTAPPAWLSAERPAVRPKDLPRLEPGATPELPAAPGDPGVPVPRLLIRRPPSGLRPRAQAPISTSAPGNVPAEPPASGHPAKGAQETLRTQEEPRPAGAHATSNDTLQQSRERVASRWFALSGLMGSEGRQAAEPRAGLRSAANPAPMLCVLSISGGVGKTSIVATLGRALSSLGEKVMLADTSVHGILPYYFGAREQRPGAVRTFSPPPGSSDAPVVLVGYDADGRGYDEAVQTRVLDDLYRRSYEVQRVLVDAGVNSAWLARTAAGANPWVLVPVAPDMNSVLGTQAVERLFQDVTGADGRPVKPYYVLNQYDPAVPLHLDVREVLRQFLGDRLLPIMLHRTSAVSEALAEGMTVIDYAPRTPIATDYMNLAAWVRKLADPGLSYARPARWSER